MNKDDIQIGILLSMTIAMTIASTSINVYCVHSVSMSHIIWHIHCSMVMQEQKNNLSVS